MDGERPKKEIVASQRASRRVRVAEAVRQCLAAKTYGDEITKAELLAWFLLAYPTEGTPAEVMRRAKRVETDFMGFKADFDAALLADHKMDVRSLGRERWRILEPSQQAAHAAEVVRDGIRAALGKGQDIVGNVRAEALTDRERARLDFESSRIAGLRQLAEKALRSRGLPSGGAK